MDSEDLLKITEFLTFESLAGADETRLLSGFVGRLLDAGVPLFRASVGVDTLHPMVEGINFRWTREQIHTEREEFAREASAEEPEEWLKSPFYLLYDGTVPLLRRRRSDHVPGEFGVIDLLFERGCTDYVALATPFSGRAVIGEMDRLYSSWATDAPEGFSDDHVAALQRLLPAFAAAHRSFAATQVAETLVATYLGRDAGRQVLAGDIQRGTTRKIRVALWYSDLQGFTRIADTVEPPLLIPLLNDYAECVATAIHSHGGEVLKFVGDGILGIFRGEDLSDACRRSLAASDDALDEADAVYNRRRDQGLPATRMYLGLHVGDVFYGNIGSSDRLDFTVVGPAVNEVSRISAMCRSLEQTMIVSAAFHQAAGAMRNRLVSMGRFGLKGVSTAQELFTLDPDT